MNLQRHENITGTVAPVNKITEMTPVALSTSGVLIEMPEKDLRTVIAVINTGDSASSVTLCAPTNGGYAAQDKDVVKSIAGGQIAYIPIETAVYANNDLTVKLKGAATLKVVVFARAN